MSWDKFLWELRALEALTPPVDMSTSLAAGVRDLVNHRDLLLSECDKLREYLRYRYRINPLVVFHSDGCACEKCSWRNFEQKTISAIK